MNLYDRIIQKRRREVVEAQKQLRLALNAKIRDCNHPQVYRRSMLRRGEFWLCSSCGLSFSFNTFFSDASKHPFTAMMRSCYATITDSESFHELINHRTFHVDEMMFEALLYPNCFSRELLTELFVESPWSVEEIMQATLSPHTVQLYNTREQWYNKN